MPNTQGEAECRRRLLDGFNTYDQHVDVVSIFEWMFTEVTGLPETVKHFERFPKIPVENGSMLTPDFTVLFKDGTAIVGEISKAARHENSIDKICKQLLNYDGLSNIPSGQNRFETVKAVSVLQLVHIKVGYDVARRIIKDRLENTEHPYKPKRRPVVVQFARESQMYHIQRIGGLRNGRLLKGRRNPNIGDYLDKVLNVAATRFVHLKAKRALINDQADRLYLATHLYSKTWPSMYGSSREDMVIDPSETASVLREHHGGGRASDVRSALELLADAGIALRVGQQWRVSRKQLGRSGDRDIHEIIARRACDRRKRKSVDIDLKAPSRSEVQEVLFDRDFLSDARLSGVITKGKPKDLLPRIAPPLQITAGPNDGVESHPSEDPEAKA